LDGDGFFISLAAGIHIAITGKLASWFNGQLSGYDISLDPGFRLQS